LDVWIISPGFWSSVSRLGRYYNVALCIAFNVLTVLPITGDA